ncbi:HET-domain-containing protein [Annulohypoxylon maeteangense]|uniref:HET-domain-containing protein n=1 Tax=Annulohypoxylon maeteangense TaxID=1927788 RepID=UPI002007A750|nr:HET-domain-containing protein [Annulohypoxylon maeteangense]KAI0886291.1 HET-domain-containing protein [Annulohypoxylon maeteangense]
MATSEFVYSQVVHPDEIRTFTLNPGVGTDRLEGSINHIQLPPFLSPTVSFSGDTRQQNTRAIRNTRRLLDIFEAHSHQSVESADFGGEIWPWKLFASSKRPRRRSIGGRQFVVEEPVLGFDCNRVEYTPRSYDALSYTWGDLQKTNEIAVDGQALGITRNLYMALVKLRSPTESRCLWIDAICIDQGNVQERNHQVQMMKRIFSTASSVIVWLGDSDGNVRDTLEMILKCSWSRGKKNLFNYPKEALQGLEELFKRTWWKRIWIIQEVVAARELVVLLGDTIFPWMMLVNLCRAIQVAEFLLHPMASMIRSCGYQKFTVLDHFRRNKAMPLVRFVHCTQDYQATDSRDKLYALLGMASDVTSDDIIPDYTKPVQEVFLDLVRFMVSNRYDLDIISSGRFVDSNSTTPSWLPDWRGLNTLRPLNSEEVGGHFYRASGNTHAVVDMAEFPSSLTAEGWMVDTITCFDDVIELAHVSPSTIQRWQSIAKENIDITMMSLFWRTIVMDKDHLGNQASVSFGRIFDDFIKRPDTIRSRLVQHFSDAVTRAVLGRRFFITKGGRMGLGPPEIQPKDQIAILKGCHVPLVLRQAGDYMIVIGEVYVSALMNGELVSELTEGRYGLDAVKLK